jgi:acyl dehydratase
VRFPSPVKVGARIRAGAEPTDVENTPAGKLAFVTMTIEVEGQDKPACVAETLSVYIAE